MAQPLLVAAAMAAALDQVVTGAHPVSRQSVAVAGHSVGELAAGVLAGVITPEDAMRLVRVRAAGMAAAAAAEPTGMTAVLGGNEDDVLAAIEAAGLTPANVNGAGQIVAAGTLAQLAAFGGNPPAGTRLRPLSVAGAFHTHHMAPAADALAAAAATVRAADPFRPLLSNRDGAVVKSGPEWLDRIINQVSAPVRWDKCMQTMETLGVTAMIELPPAGTLTGLAKRACAASSWSASRRRTTWTPPSRCWPSTRTATTTITLPSGACWSRRQPAPSASRPASLTRPRRAASSAPAATSVRSGPAAEITP